MELSLNRWVHIAAIDWLLKSAYLLVFERAAILAPFMAGLMTATHLALLCVVSFFVRLTKCTRFTVALISILTSVLFAGALTYFWISFYQSGSVTQCFRNECWWVNGVITDAGIRILVLQIGAYTILNFLTLLTSKAFGILRQKTESER